MENRAFQIKSSDKLSLFGQTWHNEQPVKGIILLLHGIGEHSSRYTAWVQRFIKEGYAVSSIDYRGHGRSEGKRGYVRSYQLLLEDIDKFYEETDKNFPGIPQFLYGHSLGGNIALNYVLQYRRCFAGLIVTSPWLKLTKSPAKLEIYLAKLINKFIPTYTASTGINPDHLSHQPEVVDEYIKDPLVHDKIGARFFLEAQEAGEFAMRSIHKINLPMLLMHGSHDKITSAQASSKFVKNAGLRTQFKMWKGLYHELHNEKENDQIFAFIKQWLQELPGQAATSKSDGYF